jgi:hypothetical protein
MDAQAESETMTKNHAGKYINLMVNYPFLGKSSDGQP